MKEPDETDLTFTRLDYLLWRVVSKIAARRPGRQQTATHSENANHDVTKDNKRDNADRSVGDVLKVLVRKIPECHNPNSLSPQPIEIVRFPRALENTEDKPNRCNNDEADADRQRRSKPPG